MKKLKKTDVIISIVIGVVVMLISAFTNGAFKAESTKEMFRHLCDAFTAPAVVLICVGALSWASSKGAYDVFGYGVKLLLGWLPFTSTNMDNVSYYDYVEEKREKRNGWRIDMLLIGAAFMVLALIMLALYYTV